MGKEKEDSKRKLIDKPSSAKKPRSTKASAHISRELRRVAAFQAQLSYLQKLIKQKNYTDGIDRGILSWQ